MRKSVAMLFILIFLITSCLIPSFPVQAEPKTIVVPDDYATISLALQNVRTGDTVFVKRGTYHEEAITINKSISLIGEGINETILSLSPPLVEIWKFHNRIWVPETAIRINADNVKLQGFTINPPNDDYVFGNGIHAVGDAISFTNNIIAKRSVYLSGSMLNLTGNSMLDALEVVGSKTTIVNNTIEYTLKVQGTFNLISANEIGNGYYWNGIHLDGSFNCVVGNVFSSMSTENSNSNVIIHNSFANLRMREYGEGECNNNIISKNRVTGKGGINDGIWLSEGENNTISANSIHNCENGLMLDATDSTAVANSIVLNNFINNSRHIKSLSGSDHTVNQFDNGTKGNYYDDYQGNDANGDGVGDSPYTVQETRWDEELKRDVTIVFFQDNYPLISPFDIDGFSVELPELVSSLSTWPEPKTSEPFPTTLILASVIIVAVACIALLVYFKKHKR